VPHLDAFAIPQVCKDTSAGVIETLAKGSLIGIGDATTGVIASRAQAIGIDEFAEETAL
jgi:hypothetical protein